MRPPRTPLVLLPLFLAALLAGACGNDRTETATTPHRAAGSASGQAGGTAAPARPAEVPPSELHVDRTEAFYDVAGASAQAILRDLSRRGPHVNGARHFARTSWTARWEITYAAAPPGGSNASCRMRRADVYVNVEVTLPRWNAPGDAPASLRRDWSTFVDALGFHEREHQESIVSAGQRVMRALDDLEAPSCSALKKKANATARPIIEEARTYNLRYDERTGHGRTQGARWPLP